MLAAPVRITARGMLDFALLPRCPGCGAVVEDDHRFCLGCWQSLEWLGEPCCDRCALPFAYASDGECAGCMAHPPRFDRLRAAVAYGDVARAVALKLKYGRRPGVAATMAQFMARHLAAMDPEALLVPVPLHRWRIWRRGYNQSALIAAALARRTGRNDDNCLLERIRATPPLQGMGRRQRADTVRGVFRVPPARKADVKGRAIMLIDDVATTGATASACAKALKRAGAAHVSVLCWARVV
ncbi:comF family protein [Allosphingosinicella indica]|uniref:ComF family protein n=2 Tax=Allosphingosinicella indica TaxID=941907 RepID=A0A1X7GR61_9SPHN|nr:comF family protein [Allosphingosinicella indica]